jgi:AcrR family transcriptional regulator
MELVAEQAGVSKATLYDNFDGKGGLTTALVDRYGNRVLTSMAVGLDRPRTARQVVGAGIRIFVEFIERDPEIYRFIVLHASDTPAVDEIAVPITALLDALLRDAGVDPRGADPLAHAVLGAVFTAAERWAAQPTMERDAFVDQLVDFVWAGLVAVGVSASDEPIDLSGLARTLEEAMAELQGEAPTR